MKTFVPNFKIATIIVFSTAMLVCMNAVAQTPSLEFASGVGNPTGNGASITNQGITFQNNTDNPSGNTFAVYAPTVTATFSLTNQQYTLSTSLISTGKGLSFGATQNNSSSAAVGFALFGSMNGISAPANNNFTSSTSVSPGTGIDVSANKAIGVFTTARVLFNAGSATNSRYYYGDLTVTFNQTVTNPVIQIAGLGGTYGNLGFTTELELQTTGVVLTKLSGSTELTISGGTKILNNATNPTATTGAGAASGSVLATGSGITTLTFKIYLRGNGGEVVWGASGNHQGDVWLIGVSVNPMVNLSGNVYNDLNGLVDNIVNGAGTGLPGAVQLYANLLNSAGKVLTSVPVALNGAYSFTNVASNTNYDVQISTNQGTMGQSAPATALPSGWANTGENLGSGAGNDGTINGHLPVAVASVNVTNANFGIERLPDSDSKWYSIAKPAVNSFLYLNSVGLLPGPLSGSDSEDGLLGSTKRVAITSLPTNGNQLWYNGVQIKFGVDGINPPSVSNPYVITSYSTSLLAVKFTGIGSTQTSFTYSFYDAARIMDATPATYTLAWSIPLPVKLSSFIVTLSNDNRVELNWTTVTEINSSYFIVERSTDGTNFSAAGIVLASGTTTTAISYAFRDNISSIQANVIYYRLRTVDIDGQSEVSETRIIRVSKQSSAVVAIVAYPNPATTDIRITIPANWQNKKIVYEVVSASGLIVKRSETANSNQTETINLSTLNAGFYIVRVQCDGQLAQQKIVKQ